MSFQIPLHHVRSVAQVTLMAYFIVNSLNMHIKNLSIVEDFRAMNAFELSFNVRGESVVA